MSMILLITYDLKGNAAAHEAFFSSLKQQGPWWHYLSNTWLISTSLTPRQLFEALQPHMGETAGNRILITPLGSYWGRLPKEAWDWIKQHKT